MIRFSVRCKWQTKKKKIFAFLIFHLKGLPWRNKQDSSLYRLSPASALITIRFAGSTFVTNTPSNRSSTVEFFFWEGKNCVYVNFFPWNLTMVCVRFNTNSITAVIRQIVIHGLIRSINFLKLRLEEFSEGVGQLFFTLMSGQYSIRLVTISLFVRRYSCFWTLPISTILLE